MLGSKIWQFFGPEYGSHFWREARRDGSLVIFHHPVRRDSFGVLVFSVVGGAILFACVGYLMPGGEPERKLLGAGLLAGSVVLLGLLVSAILLWTHHHMVLDIATQHLVITSRTPFRILKARIRFDELNAVRIRKLVTTYSDGTQKIECHVELLLSERIIHLGHHGDEVQARTLAGRLSELTGTSLQYEIVLHDGGDPPEPYVPV